MTAVQEGGEWSAARPGRTLPPGKTRYPFYRRLGGPQDRSGRAENLVYTGIRSRTVQPVAQSLYLLSYRAHLLYYYYVTDINPFKNKTSLWYVRTSPYRAVNTFHLGYKNQSVYAVSGTSRCLFSDKYKTHKYSVGRTYGCWMLNWWCITWPVGFRKVNYINPLNTKRRPLYLKTQSVPRCKHFSSRL